MTLFRDILQWLKNGKIQSNQPSDRIMWWMEGLLDLTVRVLLYETYHACLVSNLLQIFQFRPHDNMYSCQNSPGIHIQGMNEWCFRPRFCTVRLYWAGDNLGEWDEFCYEPCPWCRIKRSTCWSAVHRATTVPRMLPGIPMRTREYN